MWTDKQKNFMEELMGELGLDYNDLDWDTSMFENVDFGKKRASLAIEELLYKKRKTQQN